MMRVVGDFDPLRRDARYRAKLAVSIPTEPDDDGDDRLPNEHSWKNA